MRAMGLLIALVLLQASSAPVTYKVRLETSKGPIVIAVHRDWAPRGADRFRDFPNTVRTASLPLSYAAEPIAVSVPEQRDCSRSAATSRS